MPGKQAKTKKRQADAMSVVTDPPTQPADDPQRDNQGPSSAKRARIADAQDASGTSSPSLSSLAARQDPTTDDKRLKENVKTILKDLVKQVLAVLYPHRFPGGVHDLSFDLFKRVVRMTNNYEIMTAIDRLIPPSATAERSKQAEEKLDGDALSALAQNNKDRNTIRIALLRASTDLLEETGYGTYEICWILEEAVGNATDAELAELLLQLDCYKPCNEKAIAHAVVLDVLLNIVVRGLGSSGPNSQPNSTCWFAYPSFDTAAISKTMGDTCLASPFGDDKLKSMLKAVGAFRRLSLTV